jgi:hypothetical protein
MNCSVSPCLRVVLFPVISVSSVFVIDVVRQHGGEHRSQENEIERAIGKGKTIP